jgi:CRISPR type I-E-associated protein CasB/Cse2
MVPEKAEERAVLAAALFAWTKGACHNTPGVNFGAAFGAGLTLDEKEQREKRFIDLLDTDSEDLPYKLRQAVSLIARSETGLDWALLIRHLGQWNNPERRVQKQWARSFWSIEDVEPTAAAMPTDHQKP